MFSDIISNLSDAFGEVITLITTVLGDGFAAVGDLSSNLFGGEDA
ncbi:hypothetical protein Q9G90_02940 [Corynebacterium stationis]|nr:hypothetical protein [Corynebacterium stationis]WLP87656.1 hypothetical protein Q9G90_02940 [Corynebacterium stationis]